LLEKYLSEKFAGASNGRKHGEAMSEGVEREGKMWEEEEEKEEEEEEGVWGVGCRLVISDVALSLTWSFIAAARNVSCGFLKGCLHW